MNSNTYCIPVRIVRFVDERFPGWLQCEFTDADGHSHILIDKVPLFAEENLNESSEYPREGIVRCQILDRSRDNNGRELIRITTDRPDIVESNEGLSEFVVLADQIRPDPWPSSHGQLWDEQHS